MSETDILRQYYKEINYPLSAEGVLKLLSVVSCIACAGAAAGACVAGGGAALALASAAAQALLYAAALLGAPKLAPHAALYTDVVVSSSLGVLLLVWAALGLVLCDTAAGDYVHASLSLLSAALVAGSAGAAYGAVTRRWDAARPRVEPPRPAQADHDV